MRCAIAIQQQLHSGSDSLRLRIGVHQGEVVAEGDDLLGDAMIIAAHLEPLAEPGGICISARVREDANGKIALEIDDLGTRRAIELSPDTFDIYVRNRPPWFRPQDHELMLDRLRKAGWQG